MREYAWYSPNLDIIVIQIIMDECFIAFEWWHMDMCRVAAEYGTDKDAMDYGLWFPLGEV